MVISFTPGAGAINTMSNALASGWRRSIWGVVGQQIALIVYIVVVAAGVGVFVARSPILFTTIRYVGAAYLIYLGVRMVLTKPQVGDAGDVTVKPAVSKRAMLMQGFWVNILNPKAVVFFLAFIPQFIRLDEPQLPQYLILTVTSVVVDVVVMWGFFASAARPFGRYASTVRGQRVLNTVFGGLFVIVAGMLLFIH